jgi:hypothetical protein
MERKLTAILSADVHHQTPRTRQYSNWGIFIPTFCRVDSGNLPDSAPQQPGYSTGMPKERPDPNPLERNVSGWLHLE